MARGWESKSVESQQDNERTELSEVLTPKQREINRKRSSLELSRRRILHEIEATRSAVRRTSLEQALAYLDEELRKLDA